MTTSRTLGPNDTTSKSSLLRRDEEIGTGHKVWRKKQPQHQVLDPLTKMRGIEGEECLLPDFGRFEGVVSLEEEDILILEEPFSFRLLGSFAGRFPGMKAVEELTISWGVKCKSEALANGHVLFYFYKEDDRQKVLKGGPYALYGKRLFLNSPPNDVSLDFNDCRKLPIWIRMPWLPKNCWHVNALSKIAGNFGKPLYRDKFTMEMKKTTFARVLVEVDCSISQPDHVSIKLPGGSGNSPESNGVDIRPEVNEDNASLPKDFLNSQEEGHNTQNQVNHESGVKVAKGKGAATDIEGNSSDDDFDSSYVDSSLYGITDSNLLDPIAFLSNIEDGVFGTRSNFASASQGNPKKKKNKKNKLPVVTGGAGKHLKR